MTGDVTWEQLVNFYARVAASWVSACLGLGATVAEIIIMGDNAPMWRVGAYALGASALFFNAWRADLGAQQIAREVWKA